MTDSAVDAAVARATAVSFVKDQLTLRLVDGRTLSVPIDWSPRLAHATPKERDNWRLIAAGEGINWPDLDEDISVRHLLEGRRSAENEKSLKRWLDSRKAPRNKELGKAV